MAKNTRHSELVSESQNIEAPYELPEGWKWCRQNEVCRLTDGEKKTDVSFPYLEVKYLRGNREKDFVTSGKFITAGTKVILVDGENSGEVFTVPEDGFMGSTFKALSIQNVDENYLQFFIQSKKDLYRNNKKGSAIPHLNKDLFFNMPFPLPPTLAEQKRIVNRIETMYAKLDQAQEKAQTVLDSFETRKAAILHKAFTGQLRIDKEELKIEDWEEKKLGDIVTGFKYGVSDKCDYKNDGIPVLRIPNVGDGTIDYTDLKYSERNDIEENYIVKENDILIIRSNGSRDLVGKSALYNNTDKKFSYGSFLIKITPSKAVNPKYLVTFLNSDDARNQMFNKAKSSSGIHNINTKELSEIRLKLPSLNYQLSIVNFLDTVLEKETRAKEATQTVLDQIALLKKSILARAFRGEL